jgi:formate dehydrogenase (coenzyme F420) beta subunit
MSQVEERIRKAAAQLLGSGEVVLVLGYGEGSISKRTRPVFLSRADQVDQLIYNEKCKNNLVRYLPQLQARGKVAVVARPEDDRTLVSLIQEKQVDREAVHVITFTKDSSDEENLPAVFDTLIELKQSGEEQPQKSLLQKLSDMEVDARWKAFEEEMAKCIRCYACRNACPMCYCTECFVERSVPRWVGEGSNVSDTMIFHLTRAMHVAGRCGECNACVEACPMDVNLRMLNDKLNQDLLELYGHKAGTSLDQKAAMSTFDPNDYNDFIK